MEKRFDSGKYMLYNSYYERHYDLAPFSQFMIFNKEVYDNGEKP